MKKVPLLAEVRETGKGPAKRMRTVNRVPSVLYGRSVKPIAISVDRKEIETAVKTEAGMNVLFDLKVAGGDSGLALIRDYQADPFKRNFTHIDFQAITMKDKIAVEVPIEIVGKSIGVKEGGMLEQLRRTVLVRSMPDKIPTSIKVDITELNIGDSIHTAEIALPEGVEYQTKMNYTVVSVVPPTKIEAATPVAAAVTAEGVPVEGAVPAEGTAAAPAAGAAPAPAAGAAPAPAAGAAPADKAKGGKEKK
jgi:large subunit ribosomal protein L25